MTINLNNVLIMNLAVHQIIISIISNHKRNGLSGLENKTLPFSSSAVQVICVCAYYISESLFLISSVIL